MSLSKTWLLALTREDIEIAAARMPVMEVNMDLFITRSWQEERLILNKRLESNHKYLLDHNDAIKFWIPDIYITGMRYMSTKRGLLDLSYFMIRGDKSIYQVLRYCVSRVV
ncbi:unnamed protein product [Timema podura]|uniref:Uncharacterized protein n=1 Tax=Timema podura TaxID=61482 RepID=A0ABN7P7V2_TIMPD|nr:unnamed protein product [Timema podura]